MEKAVEALRWLSGHRTFRVENGRSSSRSDFATDDWPAAAPQREVQQLGVLHARAKVVKSYQGGPDGVPSRQKLLERVTVHQQTTVNFSRAS